MRPNETRTQTNKHKLHNMNTEGHQFHCLKNLISVAPGNGPVDYARPPSSQQMVGKLISWPVRSWTHDHDDNERPAEAAPEREATHKECSHSVHRRGRDMRNEARATRFNSDEIHIGAGPISWRQADATLDLHSFPLNLSAGTRVDFHLLSWSLEESQSPLALCAS